MSSSRHRYFSAHQKIKSLASLSRIVRTAQAHGRRVVFTNGCFDVLHAGHVKILEQAKRQGELLIVGVNSDRSVRGLKGPDRPIVGERDRALLLAALSSVDYVTIFDEATPLRVITRLRPQVLMKGADWGSSDLVGRDIVLKYGGRVARVPLLKGYSTSQLIKRIRRVRRAR